MRLLKVTGLVAAVFALALGVVLFVSAPSGPAQRHVYPADAARSAALRLAYQVEGLRRALGEISYEDSLAALAASYAGWQNALPTETVTALRNTRAALAERLFLKAEAAMNAASFATGDAALRHRAAALMDCARTGWALADDARETVEPALQCAVDALVLAEGRTGFQPVLFMAFSPDLSLAISEAMRPPLPVLSRGAPPTALPVPTP